MSCINHTCTTCPSPSPGVLFVDPGESAGGAPTGANISGCRYKTITTALNVLVSNGGNTIRVIGSQPATGSTATCTDHTGECFPITVPANVSIIGDAAQVPTIKVPDSAIGFLLTAPSSTLSNLIVDGADNTGSAVGMFGISVGPVVSPSPSPGPAIDHVTVQHFGNFAIDVDGTGARLTINQGVKALTSNKGLVVDHKGFVTVNGGADPIAFNQNVADGINVLDGVLTVNGVASTMGNGSVQANGNGNGVDIVKPPGPSPVALTGIAAWNNLASGIDILSGSPVKIRQSSVLNNAFAGVHVRSSVGLSIASVDLGSADDGQNILQDATYPNGAGICIQATDAQPTSMPAQGNTFNGTDCSQTNPTPSPTLSFSTTCGGGVDVAVTNAGTVDITHCHF
jgi:hypothetical protein